MPRYISSIAFRPDYDAIFSRLGYRKSSTQLNTSFRKEIISWIDEAASLIKLSAATSRCRTEFPAEGTIRVFPDSAGEKPSADEDFFEVKSMSFFRFLKGSGTILAMGITGGSAVMDAINSCQQDNMTKAVVFDAAAGEIVDSGFDFIISLTNRELAREGKKLMTKRFSPGYGDLELASQGDFYRILGMKNLMVSLTESFMMVPQKSVIALTGIV